MLLHLFYSKIRWCFDRVLIMPGTLYIVPTPIGNLEDITLRALRVLKEADVIAAEDTRVTRKLLSHYDIHVPLISYHKFSRESKIDEILETLESGKTVALVTDAGTPGISDPGEELISASIAHNIKIEPLPGPTAIITALVASGLSTSRFVFEGFPPRKDSERSKYFKELKSDPRTICFYESPLRLKKTLEAILKTIGDRQVAVAREITKLFEEIFRGTVSEAIIHFSEKKIQGEIVIILQGASDTDIEDVMPEVTLEMRINELISSGLSDRDTVKRCMEEFNLPKREIYAEVLRLKRD